MPLGKFINKRWIIVSFRYQFIHVNETIEEYMHTEMYENAPSDKEKVTTSAHAGSEIPDVSCSVSDTSWTCLRRLSAWAMSTNGR